MKYLLTRDTVVGDNKTTEVLGEYLSEFELQKEMLKDFNSLLSQDDGKGNVSAKYAMDYAYILDLFGKSYHYKVQVI